MTKRKHCCDEMAQRSEHRCPSHPDPFDCADNLVCFSTWHNRYGLIVHDGGASFVVIDYCPFCGTELPNDRNDPQPDDDDDAEGDDAVEGENNSPRGDVRRRLEFWESEVSEEDADGDVR